MWALTWERSGRGGRLAPQNYIINFTTTAVMCPYPIPSNRRVRRTTPPTVPMQTRRRAALFCPTRLADTRQKQLYSPFTVPHVIPSCF